MSRRTLHIFVFVLQFWFLNICIPGHTRGLITVGAYRGPGEASANDAATCGDCCSSPAAEKPTKDGQRAPTQSDRAHCAVCYFAAGLTVAPPVINAPEPSGICGRIDLASFEAAKLEPVFQPYHGRAPPSAASAIA